MKQSKNKNQKKLHNRLPKNASRLVFSVLTLAGIIFAAFFALKKDTPVEATPINGQPALEVDRQAVDLGDVKLGQPVEVSFELTNAGDQPLAFTEEPYIEVKEGC